MERCKLTLAAELLIKASDDLKHAKTDADFAAVILVAGAIYKVVAPILKANLLWPRHVRISESASRLHETLQEPFQTDAERQAFEKRVRDRQTQTYNSLKHAGRHEDPMSALDDLIVHGNLEVEARTLLEDAVYDFDLLTTRCQLPSTFKEPLGFFELLSSDSWHGVSQADQP